MANASQRVIYTEGQRISAADLQSEQAYLLALDASHNAGQHVPGVARGLFPGPDVAGDPVITAGIAIDTQGRELLSAASVPIPGDPAATCVDLWIVYCLVPLRLRLPGQYDCSPGSFQRWREFGQIVASAGAAGSDPVAPYDGAVYLGRIRCDSPLPDIGYIGLVGRNVADPGGRTYLQIGPANGYDRNGFVISATDSSGVSTPRLAIDRLGTNTFWGNVNVLSYQALALLPTPAAGWLIEAVANVPGAAGEQIRARLTPTVGAAGTTVFKLFFLIAGKPVGASIELPGNLGALKEKLPSFNKRSPLVTLNLVEEDPDQDKDTDLQPVTTRLLTGQDTPLQSSGNDVLLDQWLDPAAAAPSVPPRGCEPPATLQDAASAQPNGISFTPPPQPVKGTPLPGASAATVTENGTPVIQLRLDLGKKNDNDPSVRLAVGAPDANSLDFAPWLTADGTGNLVVTGNNTPKPTPISLNVMGSLQMGPLQADPTNPIFTNLLVLAWLHGLQSSVQASAVVDLAISGLPALIETDQPWSYQVTAKNSGATPVTADKMFETRTIAAQILLTNIAGQTTIAPGATQAFPVDHTAGDMGANTGNLSIEVRMSGRIGNFPWWKAVTAGPIPVVTSPALDISGVPVSAPPGASFSYTFTIANPAPRDITLTAVSVTEGASPPQQLNIATAVLHQGDSEPFTVNDPNGIAADLQVNIAIAFTWAGGPPSRVTASPTIKLLKDLSIDFQNFAPNPLLHNAPWTYSLVLTNTGNQTLTTVSLDQSLLGAPFTLIPGSGNIALKPNQSQTIDNIQGTPAAAAGQAALKIQSTYQREDSNRNWTPAPATEVINFQ